MQHTQHVRCNNTCNKKVTQVQACKARLTDNKRRDLTQSSPLPGGLGRPFSSSLPGLQPFVEWLCWSCCWLHLLPNCEYQLYFLILWWKFIIRLELFKKRQRLCWFGLDCFVKSQEKLFFIKECVLVSGEMAEDLSPFWYLCAFLNLNFFFFFFLI